MSRSDRPQLFTTGPTKFIQVPSDRARALHAFLTTHCVVCEQLGPSSTGLDVIALGRRTDIQSVQTLLDGWA